MPKGVPFLGVHVGVETRDDWTALYPVDADCKKYERRVIQDAQHEWARLYYQWQKMKSSPEQKKLFKTRYADKHGCHRFIYERSFGWYIHDVIFRKEERWRLGRGQWELCQFLQPVRDLVRSIGQPTDQVKDLGPRRFLIMCERAFMKTGVLRGLPSWIMYSYDRTRWRYSRDSMEYAADELVTMRSYLESNPVIAEIWPYYHVSEEKRRQTMKSGLKRLTWTRKKFDSPIIDRFVTPEQQERMSEDEDGMVSDGVIYGYRDTGDNSIEVCGVDRPPTGKRVDVCLRDDIVSTANAHTEAGRKKVERFDREANNAMAANGIVIRAGTIHHNRDANAAQLRLVQSDDPRDAKIKPRFFYRPAYLIQKNGAKLLSYPEVLNWDMLEIKEREDGKRNFMLQYMLQPYTDEDAWFAYERCQLWDDQLFEDPARRVDHSESIYILCDPSLGKTKTADTGVIVSVAFNAFRHVKILRVQEGVWQQHETERRLYEEWFYWANHPVSMDVSCYMENIAFMEAFRRSIEENAQQYDPSFDVRPIPTNTRTQSKTARIQSLDSIIYNRRLFFRARPNLGDLKLIDTTDEDAMLRSIETDQVATYEDIRDAHGNEEGHIVGGLENDNRLDALSRIRQLIPMDSDFQTSSSLADRGETTEGRVSREIQTAWNSIVRAGQQARQKPPSKQGWI
jgi:hypothetical protein